MQKIVTSEEYQAELIKRLQNQDLELRLLCSKIDGAQKAYNVFYCKCLLNKKKLENLELNAQSPHCGSIFEECLQTIKTLQNAGLELKNLQMQKDEMQKIQAYYFLRVVTK